MPTEIAAVLGGGPAGAFTAERLATAGLKTILFDERLAWEKPCGGALTAKAYQRYPFLLDSAEPKAMPTYLSLAAPGGDETSLRLAKPMLVYARKDLNRMLLLRAGRSGASVEKARVLDAKRAGRGWELTTSKGKLSVDYCVLATGARNSLRELGTRFAAADLMMALGYYVDQRTSGMQIQFLPNTEGYIWVFPRSNHTSVGICGKGLPSRALRQEVESFMDKAGISRKGAAFFAHPIPALTPESWKTNRVAGDGWLAVGDSAGLVDPITGEGLYYALRSAELASEALIQRKGGTEALSRSYRESLHADFTADLEYGAGIATRFYFGRFLFRPVIARMVQFSKRSARFAELMRDLMAGEQPYLGLRRRLYRNLNGTLLEVFLNRGISGKN